MEKNIEQFFIEVGFQEPFNGYTFDEPESNIDEEYGDGYNSYEDRPEEIFVYNKYVPPDRGLINHPSTDTSFKNYNYSKKNPAEKWSVSKKTLDNGSYARRSEFPIESQEIVLDNNQIIEGKLYKKGTVIRIKELQAEITNNKIPPNAYFNDQGNIPFNPNNEEEVKKFLGTSTFSQILNKEIIPLLTKQGLISKFNNNDARIPDAIYDKANGLIKMQTDDGKETYSYNINTKQLKKA